MAVAGRGSLAREGDRAVGVDRRCSTDTSQNKNQAGQLSFGAVSGEGKAHDASLEQPEKKTYGAERLSAGVTSVMGERVTRVIEPRRAAAFEPEKGRLPDLD